MHFSYSEIVSVLEEMHAISPDGMGAFRARLRKLQAEGIPTGGNPGKGRRVEYDLLMLIELAIATQLLESGQSPRHSANLIKPFRTELLTACIFAISHKSKGREPILHFSPQALLAMTDADDIPSKFVAAISIITRKTLVREMGKEAAFQTVTGEPYRLFTLQIRPFMADLIGAISNNEQAKHDALKVEFWGLFNEMHAEIDRFESEVLDVLNYLRLSDGNP